jgi:hypothetical protein
MIAIIWALIPEIHEERRKKKEGRSTHMSTHVGLKQCDSFFFSARHYVNALQRTRKTSFFFTEALNSERAFLLAIPSSFFLHTSTSFRGAYPTKFRKKIESLTQELDAWEGG